MKKIISPAITGVLFLAALPCIAPAIDISAIFPHFATLYAAVENFARNLIPDEIESLVSAINDTLN